MSQLGEVRKNSSHPQDGRTLQFHITQSAEVSTCVSSCAPQASCLLHLHLAFAFQC